MSAPNTAKQKKLYLDIDGVLVVWDQKHHCVELARGFGQLLRFCKIHDIKPYWLTFWSREPQTLHGINCLLWPKNCHHHLVPETLSYDREIGKAAAIDYTSDFVWIEDGIGQNDIDTLKKNNALDRFVWTNGLDVDCLIKLMDFMTEKMKLPPITDWGPPWESSFARARDPMVIEETWDTTKK